MKKQARRIRERYLGKLGIIKDKFKKAPPKKSEAGAKAEAGSAGIPLSK